MGWQTHHGLTGETPKSEGFFRESSDHFLFHPFRRTSQKISPEDFIPKSAEASQKMRGIPNMRDNPSV
jgi:hypothetical protein